MLSVRLSPDGVCGPRVRARPVLPDLQKRYVGPSSTAGAPPHALPSPGEFCADLMAHENRVAVRAGMWVSAHPGARPCDLRPQGPWELLCSSLVRPCLMDLKRFFGEKFSFHRGGQSFFFI